MDADDIEKFESLVKKSEQKSCPTSNYPRPERTSSPFRRSLQLSKENNSCKDHEYQVYFSTTAKSYADLDPVMKTLAHQIGLSKSFSFSPRYDRHRPQMKTPYTLKKTIIKPF